MTTKNLYLGNCLELLKDMSSNSIDLCITDPPYRVITGGRNNGLNSKRPRGILSENKELMGVIPEFREWLPEVYRVLKPRTHAYFMVNLVNLASLAYEVEAAGFQIHNLLVWQKNNCTPSQWYMKNCEYVIFARKGSAKWINNIGGSKTVHQFDNIKGTKVHPTEKPVPLMEFYVANSSKEGDLVLDPFMGSGATGVACLKSGRGFIGMEIDETYYTIAKERLDLFRGV